MPAHPAHAVRAPCSRRARTFWRGVLWYLRGGRVGALILLMINKVAASLAAPPRPAASPLEREPAPSAPRRRRGRGRPKGGSAGNVRERLLAAARELFLRYGYRAVSSRQIGAAAGVNFALIRYYFGGKPGLYREILQSMLPPDVGGMLGAPQEGGREMRLPDILSHMTRVWAGNPWIAGFVLREVLTPGGPMRAMFLREFPERLAPLAERALRAEMARGAIRSDLDPRLLVLSVVSLAIFPFLAFPLTSRVFGVRNDEEFVTRFLRHTQALLSSGVAPAAAAGVARAQARQ
ncbi:MAG: TetR/AcrR family transcriptional regulator [Gammaproteobacteria bacterium]|nr:MAG: TetR/AcrR family transcriptional regulator [Gammaproteobacteria bacterium]